MISANYTAAAKRKWYISEVDIGGVLILLGRVTCLQLIAVGIIVL